MSATDTAYEAFLLDYAAGALSPGERLAVELHRRMSPKGAHNSRLWDAVGGVILEQGRPEPLARPEIANPDNASDSLLTSHDAGDWVDRILSLDLMGLAWRRTLFGPKTAPVGLPMTELLRLDPGDRVPRHTHGRRDVSVILCGKYGDDFGVYEPGDIAFSHPGVRHRPFLASEEPCVCFVATETGKPLAGLFGALGLVGGDRAS